MIIATAWEARCDHKGCAAFLADATKHGLRDQAKRDGWQLGVRRDGTTAIRNGKVYCPAHRRTPDTVPTGTVSDTPLTEHLIELLDSPNPHWYPRGSGEWACARNAHSRSLLDLHMDGAEVAFSLTDSGRAFAQDAKTRHADAGEDPDRE